MRKSTRSFLFPDINVWIALTYRRHIHYNSANIWLRSVPDDAALCFSRFTQLGFLRLLTTPAVMGNQVCSQTAAWENYDHWITRGNATWVEEPPTLDPVFRVLSSSLQAAPKDWADSYLAAFAQSAGLQLVTFDQAFAQKSAGSVLLKTSK
jgi:uncharacterized protein